MKKRSDNILLTMDQIEGLELPDLPIHRVYNNWTLKLLERMARFANLAYCSTNNNVGYMISGAIAHIFKDFESNEIVAYFGGPHLSLKEWQERKNERTDYLAKYKWPLKVSLEAAWLADIEQIMPALFDKLRDLLNQLKVQPEDMPHLRFTGHGIGGVYAVLASLLLRFEIPQLIPSKSGWPFVYLRTVTFGQPRIGDTNFALLVNSLLGESVYRVTHTKDFVSHYPRIEQGYKHHESEYWISYSTCDCAPAKSNTQFVNDDTDNFMPPLYHCFGYNNKDNPRHVLTGENQKCNAGQNDFYESAHFGPYFGTQMGQC
ncbi:hypothetical protein G9A89_009858 [Geosiphon pyriformis]|nr:hypothetical protein G9A89_009858 [Geosiphon pyriformis]